VTSPATVSKERLNQIAARKLHALAIPSKLGGDGQLTGVMTFGAGRLQNPVNGQPLAGGPYVVVGHDHLLFQQLPLATVGPVMFYDCPSQESLEARLSQKLQQRHAALAARIPSLTRLKLSPELDPERLVLVSVVKATSHAFELIATPEKVFVSRIAPLNGKPVALPPEAVLVDLAEHVSGADLELHLVHTLPRMLQTQTQPPKAAVSLETEARAKVLSASPAPRGALTFSLLHQLGGDMVVTSPGLELVQEFTVGTSRYRFVASHLSGSTFKARLLGPTGEKWSDKIDLTRFPGAAQLVSTVLGLPAAEVAGTSPTSDTPAEPQPTKSPASHHLSPVPGEVWVMNVLVEREDPQEIRYVCTDIDGKPYGATRLHKREDFEAIFTLERGAWRLLIVIEGVTEDTVTYRQLNAAREPRGPQKSLRTPLVLTTFLPEAASY
jgi:hypothetical protein